MTCKKLGSLARCELIITLMIASALSLSACSKGGRSLATVDDPATFDVKVLSNRADLISGGDALVEITGLTGGKVFGLQVLLGPTDISNAFARRANGRVMGVISGLAIGENELIVRVGEDTGRRITITNYPKGGPIFAGPQVMPWICTTESNGLGAPEDEQCNTPPVYRWQYRTNTGSFASYDPENPPGDVAMTTTDQGETVPYIVRVERGVIDRGFYDIAVLFNPEESWEPWAPQRGWNGKVLWTFGSGGEPAHVQIGPPGVMEDQALSRGFAVATTAMAHNSQGFYDVVQSEAIMMVKEYFVERYGPIRYTIGTGCSGGAITQNSVNSNYPGLLDGTIPSCSFPDVLTAYTWFADCKLLNRYFTQTSPHLWNEAQRQAAMGHAAGTTCAIGAVRAESYHSPDGGSNCAEFEWSYNAVDNPEGERCSVQDYAVAVYGQRPPEVWNAIEQSIGRGFANSPYDTEGIQWGLNALLAGEILPEQFLDLNEKVGGLDIDGQFQAGRSVADLIAIEIIHRSGRFTQGREMAKLPHMELRGSSNFEWHHDFQSHQLRNRIIRDNGHADQMVYWISPGPLVPDPLMAEEAFLLMDRWLTEIEADESGDPIQDKVLRHKPADAVDACWFGGEKETDPETCDAAIPHYSDPRTESGHPPTADFQKCHLKPVDPADYASMPIAFTAGDLDRLNAIFPTGVCDLSQPSMFQQPSDGPWMTYASGPGGEVMPAPPVAQPE